MQLEREDVARPRGTREGTGTDYLIPLVARDRGTWEDALAGVYRVGIEAFAAQARAYGVDLDTAAELTDLRMNRSEQRGVLKAETTGTQVCARCRLALPVGRFRLRDQSSERRQSYCIDCQSAYQAAPSRQADHTTSTDPNPEPDTAGPVMGTPAYDAHVPELTIPHGAMPDFTFPDQYTQCAISEQGATVLAPMVGANVHEAMQLDSLHRAATDPHDEHGERIDDELADLFDEARSGEQRAGDEAALNYWRRVALAPRHLRADLRAGRLVLHDDGRVTAP